MLPYLRGGCIVLVVARFPPVSAQVREVSGRISNQQAEHNLLP